MSRRPSNSIPFTTRPASTSRHGIIRRASVIAIGLQKISQARARRSRRIFPDGIVRRARLRCFDYRGEWKTVIARRRRLSGRCRARRRNARNKNRRLREFPSGAGSAACAALDSSRCAATFTFAAARELRRGKSRGRGRRELLRSTRTWPADPDKFQESERQSRGPCATRQ